MASNPEMFDEDRNMDIDNKEDDDINFDSSLKAFNLDSALQTHDEEWNNDIYSIEESKPLRERPRCIICNVDELGESSDLPSNELVFCAHAQGSTVLKGGGGPQHEMNRFAGVHVALCGHALHHLCCEAYLTSVAGRESNFERNENIKKGEFRCPCCQRLSNCLVPFVNVSSELIRTESRVCDEHDVSFDMDIDEVCSLEEQVPSQPLQSSLEMFVVQGNLKNDFISDNANSMDKDDIDVVEGLDSKRKRTPRFRRGLSFLMRRSSRRKIKSSDYNHKQEHELNTCEFLGTTAVWHQFISRICDIAHDTDRKRLGNNFEVETNEFRERSLDLSYIPMNTRSSAVCLYFYLRFTLITYKLL